MCEGARNVVTALAFLCALLATACLQNPAVTCKNGLVCAPGNVCDDAHGGCATQSQIVACSGKAEEAACSYPGTSEGACYEGVCLPTGCGNGVMATDEACDDGNRMHGDGCSADCRSLETCGNGIVDRFSAQPEACDDGNNVEGDGCRADCTIAVCGDGITDPLAFEKCDDGVNNSDTAPDACRTNCQEHFCGDGIPDSDEVCDDGNTIAGDGCYYNCESDESCGNGLIDSAVGEQCDNADELSHDGCSGCRLDLLVWTPGPAGGPTARQGQTSAYDVARGKVVMFGGNVAEGYSAQTWTWDGRAWVNVTPSAGSPVGRSSAAMAYDAARGKVMLVGGFTSSGELGDTWEWDGAAWRNVTPTGGTPGVRWGHAMAYDAARRKLVLFGGSGGGSYLADTWEWDGSKWSNVAPTTGAPTARWGHAMAYDPLRGKIVLFGGWNDTAHFGDTWEWNGSAWTNVTPSAGSPSVRRFHALAYDTDRQRIVLVGGHSGSGYLADTWEWNGSTWADVTPAVGSPPARYAHTIAYDVSRRRLVLFGGSGATADLADTWEWSGSAWTDASAVAAPPPARMYHATAFDAARGKLVLFGGIGSGNTFLADTWEWDGSTWSRITPAASVPAARRLHSMAFDAARGKVILFGGQNSSNVLLADTWQWDGVAWTNITPNTGNPPARSSFAMASDAARKKIVLFGGFNSSFDDLADTWEWNGTTWTNVVPSSGSPRARDGHAMAYDAVHEKTVLFGGAGGGELADTWTWNGSAWTQVSLVGAGPGSRMDHAMTYDARHGTIVLFGGFAAGPVADAWEWDGNGWTDITLANGSPSGRYGHALAYDAARGNVVLFGGKETTSSVTTGIVSDTWTLRYERPVPVEACLFGRDGDDDGLVGCADPDCFGYCTPLCNPTIMTCGASSPRCGDGTCQPIETKRLCPSDCLGLPPLVCGDFLCESPETMSNCPGDCS